jgi:hypothetical protein
MNCKGDLIGGFADDFDDNAGCIGNALSRIGRVGTMEGN